MIFPQYMNLGELTKHNSHTILISSIYELKRLREIAYKQRYYWSTQNEPPKLSWQ